jgi:L-amino acid N-acyltransferase YncA
MAKALLKVLIGTAKARGLDSLWAQLAPGNGPMMAVFRRAGFSFVALGPAEGVKATLPLRARRRKAG